MSITQEGIEGERLARDIIKASGYDLFGGDWIINKDKTYYVVEVKHKERFTPPPFEGHGTDLRQVISRLEFQKVTGIRCILLVIEKPTNIIYWQFFDVLNDGVKFTTKNNVVIFPLNSFIRSDIIDISLTKQEGDLVF